ncbi:DUF4870 domain-containing protein [Brachybacterium sp. UNK5269]|uniref:DUF4870 domain-containing protein n=1 Tax=Brachybacterium sp. UNK5269 TaxID=3408576 RepID=UPI003BB1D0B4
MSQTPHPHDPYGTEPGSSASEQGAPTSDPALHPHDPYAYDSASGRPPAAQEQPAHAAPAAAGAGTAGFGTQDQYGQQVPQGGYGPGAPSLETPPAGIKGVYEGPLTGQPTSDSDSKLWAMFSQLAVILGHIVSWGFLGWVGPLIIFLVYKDRSRFARFHAAEALNGAITVVIAQVVLSIAIGIFGIVTLSFGWLLFPLVGVPALVQLVFAIIGAVKANKGEYWNYPANIRLVK